MKGKVFIDTNVLIYLFSSDEPDKKRCCEDLLLDMSKENALVWSTQVIQEFYQIMTKKLGKDPQKVKAIIKQLNDFELIVNQLPIIENAIDIQTITKYSFWDSLIISSAQFSNCTILLSEDMNHGQSVQGILISNPFRS